MGARQQIGMSIVQVLLIRVEGLESGRLSVEWQAVRQKGKLQHSAACRPR
jgi:hypothetical protein